MLTIKYINNALTEDQIILCTLHYRCNSTCSEKQKYTYLNSLLKKCLEPNFLLCFLSLLYQSTQYLCRLNGVTAGREWWMKWWLKFIRVTLLPSTVGSLSPTVKVSLQILSAFMLKPEPWSIALVTSVKT